MPKPASLILAAALAAAAPRAVRAAAADPCDGISALAGPSDCGGEPLCSPRQRVKIACALRDALETRYVFFPVKPELLRSPERGAWRFDPRRHLAACVQAERAVAREEDPLRFYDRMRRCTAAFADGHLIMSAPVKLPQVALGIGLRLAGGKVFLASREKKLVSHLEAAAGGNELGQLLEVGNEVVAVDGRPALDVVRELSTYLPASSDAARLERGVDAVTHREFSYPSRRTAALTVIAGGARRTVELPWWVAPEAESHPMTQAWLRRTRIPTTDLLAWRYDAARDPWTRDPAAVEGARRGDPILPGRDAARLREHLDEQDRPAVRAGEVVRRRDRAFCYLQILTFHTEALSRDGKRQPFAAAVDEFIQGCKEKSLDLVLDLRQNEGGYLAHSGAVFASLGEAEKVYPGGALLLRATTQNQLVYQQRSPVGGPAARADDVFDPRHIARAISAAQAARQDFTPAFLEGPVHASDVVGGYGGRIVALVAPTCMSACDRLAALLQRSGRATLVGAPTEGAGGSQQETRSLSARWTDPEGVLSLSMPNAAMGVQAALPGDGGFAGERPAADFFQALTFENKPIVPDVSYATTVDDLLHANRGWLRVAEEALFQPPEGGDPPVAAASAGAPGEAR